MPTGALAEPEDLKAGRRPLLFDTSVLIPMIRGDAYERLFFRSLRSGRARISSVVMQELYAGARAGADKKNLDGINRAFAGRGYLVTPDHDDWVFAGIILARYQNRHGKVEPRHHINDILILLGAARSEAALVTENAADMIRWRRMTRGAYKGLQVFGVRRAEWRDA